MKKILPALLKHSAKAACGELLKKIKPQMAWGVVGFGLGFLLSCCFAESRPERAKPACFRTR